jgi:hypothetical protein
MEKRTASRVSPAAISRRHELLLGFQALGQGPRLLLEKRDLFGFLDEFGAKILHEGSIQALDLIEPRPHRSSPNAEHRRGMQIWV